MMLKLSVLITQCPFLKRAMSYFIYVVSFCQNKTEDNQMDNIGTPEYPKSHIHFIRLRHILKSTDKNSLGAYFIYQ